MTPDVQEWLYYAKMDLDTATHMYDSFYPRPFQIICFHCQQTAEKSIKAMYIAKKIPNGLPKMHDLEYLLSQIKNYIAIRDEFWDYADILTPYGIQARYPTNTIEFTDTDTEQAIKYATAIYNWATEEAKKS